MAQTLFRDRQPGQQMEVTSLELFFDLVFVFAVTQISHLLLEHLNWLGALEAALLLMVVWWAWSNSTWMTNLLDPGHYPVALMLLALMGVGLVFSSSLPEAFGSMGLVFALSFVTFQLSCTLFMRWATRSRPAVSRNFLRVALWLIGTASLWIAGGVVEGESRLRVWALALFIDYLAPVVAFWLPVLGRSDTHDWGVTGLHVAERYGLFVMIALGESILFTGAGFAEMDWSLPVVLAASVSFLQSAAMWWIYFHRSSALAADIITSSSDPGGLARRAYVYVPLLFVAGIVVAAVGDELVLAHPLGPTDPATAWVLIGGPALFLAGAIFFEFGVFDRWSLVRLGGMAVTLLLAVLSVHVPADACGRCNRRSCRNCPNGYSHSGSPA